MTRFYIAALILVFCQTSSAELTNSDQTQVDETQITQPSTGGYNKATCDSIEAQFQNYIMSILDGAISASSKSYNCLMGGIRNDSPDCKKLNSMNLGNLKKYRRSLKKLYQEAANNWVKEKSKQDARFKACLGLPVQFKGNIRTLKTKLPYYRCQPIVTRWSHDIDQLTKEYLDGKRTITSLNPEEIINLKTFHHSPLKRIISTDALFDTRLSDSELKQKLASAYKTIKTGVEKLKNKIGKLKNRQKYILFDFQNQFTFFTNALPVDERPRAIGCMKETGLSDCTTNLPSQGQRCLDRIRQLGAALLPIVPVVDSIGEIGDVMSAEASGAMTSSEASQKRAELATLGILGLSGIAGVASLAKPFIRSATRTSAVRTSGSRTTGRSDNSTVFLQRTENPSSISRNQLVSSHIKSTNHLERMGVDYSKKLDSKPSIYSLIRTGEIAAARDFNSSGPFYGNILRIRKGATGRRHTNPRGLALKHKDIDAKIKEAEQMGVKVVIDTTLNRTGAKGYYRGNEKILAISSDSNWLTFEHEFQHALFSNYLLGHVLRDSPFNSVRLISNSGQSLRQMRQQLPAQIRRNWTEKEQDVVLRYMKDDMPIRALDERLSVNRELELLGWRRYTPYGQKVSRYATIHLINGLQDAGPLTARQMSIKNQAYITLHAQARGADATAQKFGKDSVDAIKTFGKYNEDAAVQKYGEKNVAEAVKKYSPSAAVGAAGGLGLSGAAAEIKADSIQREDSFLSNLPKNIRSAIQSAEEVFYSERGILVRDQNGQAQFFPSEKRE